MLLFFTLLSMAVAQGSNGNGISSAGNGCGTWYITTTDCSPISASEYWDFNFTFTQGGVGSTPVTTMVQIAATTEFADRWGLYFSAATPSVCVDGSSTSSCGTFSSLISCNQNCDSALNPICQGVPVVSAPGTQHNFRFGIRKNNNGAGPCTVGVAVFLPTTNGITATCDAPVTIDQTCPGTLTSGYAGPTKYSAGTILSFSSVLVLALILCL